MFKISKLILFLFLVSNLSYSQTNPGLRNVWQIGFTFGEIPILANSFKPGISVGYHFNEYVYAGVSYQLNDNIQRDDESFNAADIGLEGLNTSKERTGERMLVGFQVRPHKLSPYLSVGYVYNNSDVEKMTYKKMERTIGSNTYDSIIKITQTRDSGFEPALGIGYEYDFDNGFSLNTSITMALFSDIPDTKIDIESSVPLSGEDESVLRNKVLKVYKDNTHNHYHIFNLGLLYRFK